MDDSWAVDPNTRATERGEIQEIATEQKPGFRYRGDPDCAGNQLERWCMTIIEG